MSSKKRHSDFGHKRFFSGAGFLIEGTKSVGTDIRFHDQYGYEEEVKLHSATFAAFNIQWLDFYVSHRFAIDLSTQYAFLKHKDLTGFSNVTYSGKMTLNTNSLILKYNFSYKNEPDPVYSYFGMGPCFIQYDNLRASGSDDSGNKKEVKATFDPVYGLTLKLGCEGIISKNGMIGLHMRLGIPFSTMKVKSLSEKENGHVVNTDPGSFKSVYPIYWMLCMNICIGY